MHGTIEKVYHELKVSYLILVQIKHCWSSRIHLPSFTSMETGLIKARMFESMRQCFLRRKKYILTMRTPHRNHEEEVCRDIKEIPS